MKKNEQDNIKVYTADSIIKKQDGSLFLKIELNNHAFELPLKNVGTNEQPEYIAIVDPKNPEIKQHGAEVISAFLQTLQISLVLSAPSLKAEEMIKQANTNAQINKEPIFFIGGSINKEEGKYIYSREEVIKIASVGNQKVWIEECRPITLAPNEPSKFFAINESMLRKIISAIKSGQKLALVDDVYSSGATVKALKKLLEKALLESNIEMPNIPIVVIAREALETQAIFENQELLEKYNEALNLYASILIPVILEIPKE